MSQAYQPLHHKYRPQRFDQLVGQDAIAATLGHALRSDRIPPAYLFSRPRRLRHRHRLQGQTLPSLINPNPRKPNPPNCNRQTLGLQAHQWTRK